MKKNILIIKMFHEKNIIDWRKHNIGYLFVKYLILILSKFIDLYFKFCKAKEL